MDWGAPLWGVMQLLLPLTIRGVGKWAGEWDWRGNVYTHANIMYGECTSLLLYVHKYYVS